MTDSSQFPIVGIGASAGGIPALQGLFSGLQTDCGLGIVIVTHLSPDRHSLLHEVLARFTAMPVKVAEDGLRVEINHVYVMPENSVLEIEGGMLKIKKPDVGERERKPVDIFFASLAEDRGELSISIVLSGGDGDGTLGSKAIKEAGGLTLAQAADGSGPKHPDMPQSAISSGMIDISVPVEEMGDRLVSFARSFGTLDGLVQDDGSREDAGLDAVRGDICAILSSHTGQRFLRLQNKDILSACASANAGPSADVDVGVRRHAQEGCQRGHQSVS